MPNRSSNRGKGHKDLNETAFSVVQQATGQIPKTEEEPQKNPAAVTLDFVRIHQTLRVTPAMAGGVADRAWEISDIVSLFEEYERQQEAEEKARRLREVAESFNPFGPVLGHNL
jgi:hypothetical protein